MVDLEPSRYNSKGVIGESLLSLNGSNMSCPSTFDKPETIAILYRRLLTHFGHCDAWFLEIPKLIFVD